jgi:HSP20 family protein
MDNFVRPTYAATSFQPSCDITETNSHYLVSFDMPGLKTEDIKIEVQNNQLVISGERHYVMNEDGDGTTLHHERSYGKFERTFVLPSTINTEKIEAHFQDGVLNVALPKAENAKGRSIQIQTGQAGFFNKLLGTKKESAKELKDIKVS